MISWMCSFDFLTELVPYIAGEHCVPTVWPAHNSKWRRHRKVCDLPRQEGGVRHLSHHVRASENPRAVRQTLQLEILHNQLQAFQSHTRLFFFFIGSLSKTKKLAFRGDDSSFFSFYNEKNPSMKVHGWKVCLKWCRIYFLHLYSINGTVRLGTWWDFWQSMPLM